MSPLWSAAATGATPYAEDAGLFSAANGRLRFRPGATGRIRFVCDVTNVQELDSVRHLNLTFRDAGRAEQGQGEVDAVLKKVQVSTGSIDNVTAMSSRAAQVGPDKFETRHSNKLPDNETPLDDSTHYYYVVITMERSDDETQNPTVLGVTLDA
jgi:hypothetical protein